MPGLLTLRSGFGSASKAPKGAISKYNVSSAKTEKSRDERSLVTPQGGKVETPPFVRRAVYRAPVFNPFPSQMPVAVERAKPQQVRGLLGHIVKTKVQRNGLDIARRVDRTYSSSGSEHEINSVCLAEMVHEFMEDDAGIGKCGRVRCNCESGTCADPLHRVDSDENSNRGRELTEMLQGVIPSVSFSEKLIYNSVTSIVESWSDQVELATNEKAGRSFLMRHVMSSLRAGGYNAAICKSRWKRNCAADGFPGGEYEYIDVIVEDLEGATERIIVDINFKTQFEIARPTPQYAALLQIVPAIYVGKADRLQQIVNILCDAAQRSLEKKGMHLPPWRRPDYIRAKWFTSYRRTTNEAPTGFFRNPNGVDAPTNPLTGARWDSKFTTEMEINFHKAADLRKVLGESNGTTSKMIPSMIVASKKHPEIEPEGVVRGANRVLAEMQLADRRNSSSMLWWKNDDIEVAGAVWEPPVVNFKPSAQKASRKLAGLATVLREAGMIGQTTHNLPNDSQEREDMAGTSHRQDTSGASRQRPTMGGALSRELALERA